MENWNHKEQETEGTYMFSGQFLATRGVVNLIGEEVIKEIYIHIRELVKEKNGLDYLQVFVHKTSGQKLFFIDQLNREMIASGGYEKEHNHCTLMLAEEY